MTIQPPDNAESLRAAELLGVEPRWLQPFDVVDPFNGRRMEGWLSQRPDHRYGALAILRIDGLDAPQMIYATPKLHYPFDRAGTFKFPPARAVEIYRKLDGTNITAYQYRDASGELLTTYKLRLSPILRNGRFGAFLDLWREMLAIHPAIPTLPQANGCAISFELYGSRNPHLILYEQPLAAALLFGVDAAGRPIPPSQLQTAGVPTAELLACLSPEDDLVAGYQKLRADLQAAIRPADDEKLCGDEGAVWYLATPSDEVLLFKCKPEAVEAIHWVTGLSKEVVRATAWNLLETSETLSYEALFPLLLEEYTPEQIERFRPSIDEVLADIQAQLAFRERILAAYRATGLRLNEDKRLLMRALAGEFEARDMKKVYTILVNAGVE